MDTEAEVEEAPDFNVAEGSMPMAGAPRVLGPDAASAGDMYGKRVRPEPANPRSVLRRPGEEPVIRDARVNWTSPVVKATSKSSAPPYESMSDPAHHLPQSILDLMYTQVTNAMLVGLEYQP